MHDPGKRTNSGIALIIVMVVIAVLSLLAGGFAFSMKVETRLASNSDNQTTMDWLARSGVELGRYVLSMQSNITPGFDSLNQKWADGSGETNDLLAPISLVDNELGPGRYSIKIEDHERKLNINMAGDELLQHTFNIMGVDPREAGGIIESLRDWIDQDDHPHLVGAESDDYLSRPNEGFLPYFAKNGPVDELTELLMIRGVTPEMFWGFGPVDPRSRGISSATGARVGATAPPAGGLGLVDLFTAVSGPQVNVNTASALVLQVIPGVDPDVAIGIIQARAGLDGVDGTEDDLPFRNVGELINVPGVTRQMIGQLQRYLSVRSFTFEVRVDAQIGDFRRRYQATLRRVNNRDVQILSMHPE